MEALLRKWEILEGDLRATTIPALLKLIEHESIVKKKQIEGDCQWKVRLVWCICDYICYHVSSLHVCLWFGAL